MSEIESINYELNILQCQFEQAKAKRDCYKQCIDEIERICDFNYTKENTRILANEILQLLKQAKEGGE